MCENRRTMELYLIRFNCDKYDKEKSLFKFNAKLGKIEVRCTKAFDERVKILNEKIEYYRLNVPEKTITSEYLLFILFKQVILPIYLLFLQTTQSETLH